jgi:hypothetical protein
MKRYVFAILNVDEEETVEISDEEIAGKNEEEVKTYVQRKFEKWVWDRKIDANWREVKEE